MNYTMRSMQPEDYKEVLEIFQEGIETKMATFDTELPTWESWDMNFHKNCRLVLIDEKETVIGWAALKLISTRSCYSGVAEVSVYVSGAFQGRGLGTMLLKRLVQLSESSGFWTLQSGVFPENISSLSIHHKAGFRTVGKREKLGKIGEEWKDVLLLERRSPIVF